MKGFNITLPRLLLQFLIVASCFISLGFASSAWAVGYTLTASASPTAGGTVAPYGGSYLSGAKVTITATPKTGYKFSSWSGCSSTTTACTVTMTKNTVVTANFVALPTYTLSASASPSTGGTVFPLGGSYLSGATVTLTATPKTGYKFSSWSGCSSTTTVCTVTMTSNKSVVASFVALPPVPQAPTLNNPANGATNVSQSNVSFSWSVANAAAAQVNNYRIVISQDQSFSGFNDTGTDSSSCSNNTCLTTTTGTTTSFTKNMDLAGKTYYWKVRANGLGGVSPWSVTRSFTTAGLSTLTAVNLVFPSTGSGWTNTSGSPYHIKWTCAASCSKNLTLDDSNALDLNLNTPTHDSDAGKYVYPIADGTVFATSDKYGFVLVKHSVPLRLDDGTVLNTWYSGYMHMSNRKSTGSVTTGTSIGNVSNVGATNNHLHFVIYQGDGATLSSINVKGKLSSFASKIAAWY